MPLFKSFRSKSSLKSSGASILSENDQSTDFGPRSPSSNTLASRKGAKAGIPSDYGGSVGRAGRGQSISGAAAQISSSPSGVSVRTSQSTTALKQQQPNMMEFVQPSNGTGTGNNSITSSPARPSGPRPSELFAGKGVQWDSVKLAGPGSAPAAQNRAVNNNTEDLQNFLKQRRQWKPTFVTEEAAPRQQATTDLSKLSFMTQEKDTSRAGILSFDELDKSHQRKQQLLSDNPLGANLWDEAETSKAGEARAAAAAANSRTSNAATFSAGTKTGGSMPPPPVVKRSGSSFYSRRKSLSKKQSNSSLAAAAATSSSDAAPPLPGNLSAQAINALTVAGVQNGGAVKQNVESAPTNVSVPNRTDATNNSAAAANAVRPSSDMSVGFATPAASSPPTSTQHLASSADAAPAAATEADAPLTPRADNVEAPNQSTPVRAV